MSDLKDTNHYKQILSLGSDRSVFMLGGDLFIAKTMPSGVNIIHGNDIIYNYEYKCVSHLNQFFKLYELGFFREIYIQHSLQLDMFYGVEIQSSEKFRFHIKSGSKETEIEFSIYITVGEAINIIKERLKI